MVTEDDVIISVEGELVLDSVDVVILVLVLGQGKASKQPMSKYIDVESTFPPNEVSSTLLSMSAQKA